MGINPFGHRPPVLVADNDLVLRSVLRALFARLGLDVVLASDAAETITQSRQGRRPCLILLDLDMPGGGLQACRALRADAALADVPIAILTGYTDPAIRDDCLASGATLFLTKPFNPAELLGRLEPCLALSPEARRELAAIVSQDRGLLLQDVVVARTRPDAASLRAEVG